MRGSETILAGVPQAAAVLDLALNGVVAEMADVPFDWMASRVAASLPGVSAPVPDALAARPAVLPRVAPTAAPPAAARPAPEKSEKPDVIGRVWHEGEAASVVLVVQGGPPDARCRQLAAAMLAAVGLPHETVGWVGYEGPVTPEALRAAVGNGSERHVLVMGQGPLGILLGRNLGVEGWHAAGGTDALGVEGFVGVTYPLELLLKQPLFKRLAWQHMLAWGLGNKTGA